MTPLAPEAEVRGSDRALVAAYGWNAAAVQVLNPSMRRWRVDGAVVGYIVGRRWPGGPRVWLAAGDPICDHWRRGDIVRAFGQAARAAGATAAWFGASASIREVWSGSHLVIGAQPVWAPEAWQSILAGKASLRQQVNRARNKGVAVEPLAADRATILEPIRAAWLARRGLPPLSFMVQSDVLAAPEARRFLVARRGHDLVGYLVLAPVPARDGVFVEWIIQAPEAPNGTAALLLDAAFRLASGASLLTLGLVPLSTFAPLTDPPPPPHLRLLLWWMRAHARRFYNFEGLERFKAKFQPLAWEPLYLLAPENRVGLPLLHAVSDAFAGARSPEALIAMALAAAARAEITDVTQALGKHLGSRPDTLLGS